MTPLQAHVHESWPGTVVAITGSSGLIGSALARALESHGHVIKRLVRRPANNANEIAWDPLRGQLDPRALEGVEVVVNLAGESLDKRWTTATKTLIRDSRVKGTALLARTIASLPTKPLVFLSGSAMGIYGSRGDETLDEASTLGNDFLASVCKEWEAATAPAADAGIRVVNLRTGLVLARHGGALRKMLLPFQLGIGGRLGDGRQWTSWIALSELVDALSFAIRRDSVAGPVNLVAPNPVTNREFARTLGYVLGRPAFIPVPHFALKLVFGEMAEGTILASQRMRPRRLLEHGFDFALPTLERALRAVLA